MILKILKLIFGNTTRLGETTDPRRPEFSSIPFDEYTPPEKHEFIGKFINLPNDSNLYEIIVVEQLQNFNGYVLKLEGKPSAVLLSIAYIFYNIKDSK